MRGDIKKYLTISLLRSMEREMKLPENSGNRLGVSNLSIATRTMCAAFIFISLTLSPCFAATFVDVPESHWAYEYIEAIYSHGITRGCSENPLMYCPDQNVTRGQMAAFIIRAKYGETFSYTTTPYFTDVPSTHTFFKYVQKLRDDGITVVNGTYGVDTYVSRGQMAAFIIRAKFGENFSYTTTPYFSDVPSTNSFFKYVQKLKDEGITAVTGTYGVDNIVTRAQMAAFISRAFVIPELTVEDLRFAEIVGTESSIIAVASDKNAEEEIGIIAERDAAGNPTRVTRVIYISEQGGVTVEVDTDGVPTSFTEFSGYKVTFESYTNSTVNLSLYDASGNKLEGPITVNIDSAKLEEIKEAFRNLNSLLSNSFTDVGPFLADQSPRECADRQILKASVQAGSLVFAWTVCLGSIFTGDLPVAFVACTSALVSSISALTPNQLDDVASIVLDAGLCGTLDLASCISAFVNAAILAVRSGCVYIAGTWNGSETSTVTCTVDGETETATSSVSGTITVNQNGCNVNYTVPNSDVDRAGTVHGNNIQLSGIFMVGEGLSFTQNSFTATGTICGGEMNMIGTGIAAGTFCDEDGCYNFSCSTISDTATLVRSHSTSALKTTAKERTARKPSGKFLNNSLKVFTTISSN